MLSFLMRQSEYSDIEVRDIRSEIISQTLEPVESVTSGFFGKITGIMIIAAISLLPNS